MEEGKREREREMKARREREKAVARTASGPDSVTILSAAVAPARFPPPFAQLHVPSFGEMSTLDPSETPSAARPPPASLTNLQEILAAISSLESEEAELSASLAQLLAQREPIVQSLDRLQTLEPHLDDLHYDASLLSGKVSATARTAERVGGRVRSLDEEMQRVRDAGERVGQVMELKVCARHRSMAMAMTDFISCTQSSLDALKRAIEIQDWESATRHCARAMALPASVISGPFAETTVVRRARPDARRARRSRAAPSRRSRTRCHPPRRSRTRARSCSTSSAATSSARRPSAMRRPRAGSSSSSPRSGGRPRGWRRMPPLWWTLSECGRQPPPKVSQILQF